MKRHVNLPYLRASAISGDHERDKRDCFIPESVWITTMAENEKGNSHGTYLIAILASQRGHTRSEYFCPSRYVSRLLKE